MKPRTTICCTVGPACDDRETLRRLVEAGAGVFRLNGAMVEADDIAPRVDAIRGAAADAGAEVGILLDLPGSGLRLGDVGGEGRFAIREGDRVRFGEGGDGDEVLTVAVPALGLLQGVETGQRVYLGDGRERLDVVGRDGTALLLAVRDGGEVRTGMGLHLPGFPLPTSVPTREDRRLLAAGVAAGVDFVAQSFVRSEMDVARLKEVLGGLGARGVFVLAKIEHTEAVAALEPIVQRADGVIVARGDLGIDMGIEHVPAVQRRVVETCRRHARPVVIATEMLASMTVHPRPTRAEASDVAGAVFEGVDAVLLAGETALGTNPVRATETMARILHVAEQQPDAPYAGSPLLAPPELRPGRPDQHVVRAAVDLARQVGARAIVAFTRHGSSAFRLSKERPRGLVLALTPRREVLRRLALAWGVDAVRIPESGGIDEIVAQAVPYLRQRGGLDRGDLAVAVMGGSRDPAGATTVIKLLHL